MAEAIVAGINQYGREYHELEVINNEKGFRRFFIQLCAFMVNYYGNHNWIVVQIRKIVRRYV